jgi:hypothetical protein
MAKAVAVHEGVIHPGLVAELEAFRAPGRLVSSYYLDLSPRPATDRTAADALKSALAGAKAAIEQVDARPAIRHALRRDWDLVAEQTPAVRRAPPLQSAIRIHRRLGRLPKSAGDACGASVDAPAIAFFGRTARSGPSAATGMSYRRLQRALGCCQCEFRPVQPDWQLGIDERDKCK